MPNYYFEIDEKNFKKRSEYWEDIHLKNLIHIMIQKENRIKFSDIVIDLFNLNTLEDINFYYNNYTIYYDDIDLKILNKIIFYFKSWISKNVNINNLKGAYVELLYFKLVSIKYDNKNIERECYICSKNFRSIKTIDVVISCNPIKFIASECKFSDKAFTQRDFNNLVNIKNNFKNSTVNLIINNDSKQAHLNIKNRFRKIKNINKKLLKINIINLKDF